MTNSSIIQGITIVSENLAATAIDISNQNGIWTFLLYLFAFIGFVSLVYSVFNNIWKGASLVGYGFVFIPAAFIVSLVNKKKRKERLKEWGDIKRNLTGKNKFKFYLYLIIKIGVPIVIALFVIRWMF